MQALPDTADPYGVVFDRWVAKHQPRNAILVVRRNGKTVFARGQNADPFKPTMIASLSKPITGACVATLIRDGKVSFTTRLRNALSRFFTRYGTPADPRLADVTVEELLVHRSGLMGNGDDDPIYGVMNKRAYMGKGYLGAIQSVLSEYLMKLHLIRRPGTQYAYSNTGYEVLSAMIEERTGQHLRGLLPRRGVRQARHRRAEAASGLAHAVGRRRLVRSGAGLSCVPGHLQPVASVPARQREKLDRPRADQMDAGQQGPLVRAWPQHMVRVGPLDGLARRHPQ